MKESNKNRKKAVIDNSATLEGIALFSAVLVMIGTGLMFITSSAILEGIALFSAVLVMIGLGLVFIL